MSLAEPLGLAAFYDLYKVADVKLALAWSQEMSLAGGGERLYADRAPALWHADITTVPMSHADAEGIMALINSRSGGLRTVLLSNPRLPFPASDPDGALFGAATPAVGTITDRMHVAFTGFPADYAIPLGTYFQVIFGTSRYYLGQFAEARTASGTGAVSAVEVAPPLPASIATGDAVTVIKPCARCTIVPGTAYPSRTDAAHSTISFSAEQTYRA